MATIFSSVLLGIMSDITTDLVTKIATSLFVADRLLSFIGGAGVSGIMEASTQQLGLGLILSTLLITVPPMAGLWFNGMMGNFTPFSPLNTWGVRGSQGMVPPNVDGGRSMQQQVENRVAPKVEQLDRDYGASQSTNTVNNPFIYKNSIDTIQHGQVSDSVKSQSQLGQAVPSTIRASKHDESTDKLRNDKGEKA